MIPLDILRLYRSPKGWAFLPIHYSHDPEKDQEWEASERLKYTRDEDFQREQNIDFGLHVGAGAYPQFRSAIHVVDDLPYDSLKPLCLIMDFNVSPMSWLVGQIVNGWAHVIEELVQDPGTVHSAMNQFRNWYPAHKSELWIYGDASGHKRGQTARTDYEIARLELRGYSAPIITKAAISNPHPKDRINAVNRKLMAADGFPGIKISRKCKELIQDLQEVVMRPDGKDLLKVYDTMDPYSKRTHTSDALGYWIWREWPVGNELARAREPRKPRRITKLLGDLYYKGKSRN